MYFNQSSEANQYYYDPIFSHIITLVEFLFKLKKVLRKTLSYTLINEDHLTFKLDKID